MPVYIALFRAVNLVGVNRVSMSALRQLFTALKCTGVTSHINSGNVVFKTRQSDPVAIARRIESAFAAAFGFQSDVILRTPADLRDVLARNPFANRADVHPSKLLITFLAADPGEEARQQVRALPIAPEELFIHGREMFVHYPNGMGRTKFPALKITKILKTAGTGRNVNTVTKLLEIAEA